MFVSMFKFVFLSNVHDRVLENEMLSLELQFLWVTSRDILQITATDYVT